MARHTVLTLRRQKQAGDRITMLTAYDYTMARLLDEAGVEMLLVGDSLGMVMLGYEDTLSVTMEDMIHHSRAVARGAASALVVTDMPFMSYHVCVEEAVRNAGRLVREGHAQAVKLEGGTDFCPHIAAITRASIPVVAHLGLTPQSVNALGGYRVQGREARQAQALLDDARAVQQAGAFALVLECVPAPLAARITQALDIPVIGIGAGAGCDGQVLVAQDMLGMFSGFRPRFVRRFAEGGELVRKAAEAYCHAVKAGEFPAEEHGWGMEDDVLEKVY
ncbi:MAG: 3-methyl-2-oxobutanoate hydroxymethyltransferase [Desulfovibrionaceae bacterium]|nr:3-methyl-2-oxobutanoate hydroxymethyltransferase [Desulfovibrionaceae bacterium]